MTTLPLRNSNGNGMIQDRKAQSVVWGFLAMLVFVAVAAGLVDIYRLYAARNWAYGVAQEAAMAGASRGRDWSSISIGGDMRLNAVIAKDEAQKLVVAEMSARGISQYVLDVRVLPDPTGGSIAGYPPNPVRLGTGKGNWSSNEPAVGVYLEVPGQLADAGYGECSGEDRSCIRRSRGGAMNHWLTLFFNRQRKLLKIFGFLSLVILLLVGVQIALANISPDYLKNGRTYDQESSYIQWNGSVSYVTLYHRDNTSLPPAEGGANCTSGCTEQVTRIQNGSSVSGNFTYLQTFNIQVSYSGDSAVGTAVVKACGQTITTQNLYVSGDSTPGFNNFPSPAWNVPTAGDCTWSISATGGYVDFRAVTTSYRSTPAPTVDLKVNASNGPLNLSSPASYTLSWTSTNAAVCSASGGWSGNQVTNGSQAYSSVATGSYTYTITCTNPGGSASDSVTVNVLSAPTVSVTAPASMTAPASYTATWTSSNAVSCTGSNRFTGLSGLSGSKAETALPAGTYDYTVTCTNGAGVQASDTKRTTVYAAPTVDVKVDGSDGPTITRTGPVSYIANWTSTNATQCTGSSRLTGYSGTSGARSEVNVLAGTTYDYMVTCQNAAGATISDSVRMVVVAAPAVDVKVNSSDGPLSFYEPAGFTVTWTSSNASSCTALNNLTGPIGTNGTKPYSNVLQGVYRYTVQCANTAGTTVIDSVIVNVNPLPPVVDLKVDGSDGPITRVSPAGYTLSWTSQYAASCTASSSDNGWVGNVILSGTGTFANIPVGTHIYKLTCTNVSGTVSDTVTVYVVAPLSGTISVTYAKLLLDAPNLGQPAQSLSGTTSGGEPPYSILVHVRTPTGSEMTFSKNGSSWSLTPASASIPNFGTTEEGIWTAWAVITDLAGRTFRTTSITWAVSWHPVHGRP